MAEGWKPGRPVQDVARMEENDLAAAAERALAQDGDLYGMRFNGGALENVEGKNAGFFRLPV